MLEINKKFKKCFQLKNGSKLLLLNEQWFFLREGKNEKLARRIKMNYRGLIALTALMISEIGFSQPSVSINSKVVSTSGIKFLQQLDNRTEAFPRALRNQQKSEFDVLSLMVMFNQTANIEDIPVIIQNACFSLK